MIYLGDGVVGGCLAAHEVVVGINPIVAFENSYRIWSENWHKVVLSCAAGCCGVIVGYDPRSSVARTRRATASTARRRTTRSRRSGSPTATKRPPGASPRTSAWLAMGRRVIQMPLMVYFGWKSRMKDTEWRMYDSAARG